MPTFTIEMTFGGTHDALECGGKRQRHAAFGGDSGREQARHPRRRLPDKRRDARRDAFDRADSAG